MSYRSREILRNNAGARVSRRAMSTGVQVTLYDAILANLDSEDGRWAAVCEDHGCIVSHRTRRAAESWLPHPEEWCEECRAVCDSKTK